MSVLFGCDCGVALSGAERQRMRNRTAAFGYNLHEPADYAVADSTAECLRRCDSLGMRLVDRVVGEVHKRIGRRRRRSRIPAHQNVRCNAATPRCNLYGSIPRPWPSLTTPCPGQLIQCSGPTGLAQPSPAAAAAAAAPTRKGLSFPALCCCEYTIRSAGTHRVPYAVRFSCC